MDGNAERICLRSTPMRGMTAAAHQRRLGFCFALAAKRTDSIILRKETTAVNNTASVRDGVSTSVRDGAPRTHLETRGGG